MSIRQRIVLLVALVFCALALIGGYAIHQARSNSAQVRQVTEQVVPSSIQSVELMTRLKDVQIAALSMVAAPDADATQAALAELNARKAGLESILQDQLAQADNDAQRGLIREASASLVLYFDSINATAKFKLAGNQAMADANMGATVDQYLREQGQMIDAVQVEKRRSKDAAIAALNRQLGHTSLVLTIVSAVAILGLGVIGLLLYRQVVHPIAEMEAKMTEIATSQDFTHRLKVSRGDEIGRSMTAFNAMVEKIERSTALVRQKAADIQALLQNIPQGILTVQAGGRVHPEHSAYLRTILETDEIAGRPVTALVLRHAGLGDDALDQAAAAIDACIGEDEMNFGFNAHLLPTEIRREMHDGRVKVLELGWSPILDDSGTIDRLMLCVRDVTELRALARAAGAQKRELEIIGQVLAVSHEKFHAFEQGSLAFVAEGERIVDATDRAGAEARAEAVALLFRQMHTIKGNARTYGLTQLADVVHRVEQSYDAVRRDPASWFGETLRADLQATREAIEEYGHVNAVKLGRTGPGGRGDGDRLLLVARDDLQSAMAHLADGDTDDAPARRQALALARTTLRRAGTDTLDEVLRGVVDSLPALAMTLGKEPPQVLLQDHGIRLRGTVAAPLRNAFMHLMRNAMDHGLEAPLVRLAHGKSAAGRIRLSMALDARHLRLRLQDDGQGLHLERIRARAIEQGLVRADQPLDQAAIAQLIFAPGFSTAAAVTDVSGRGVGLDAVVGFMQAEGGDVAVELLEPLRGQGQPFAIVVTLPSHVAVGDEARGLAGEPTVAA
ncbi:HAMP domain-containing protein [Xylophilus sp. Kf1]|nr:HAMP domain-containing protein [Xylophilus sp. Kf1]